mgnify:CR=1 FL=1
MRSTPDRSQQQLRLHQVVLEAWFLVLKHVAGCAFSGMLHKSLKHVQSVGYLGWLHRFLFGPSLGMFACLWCFCCLRHPLWSCAPLWVRCWNMTMTIRVSKFRFIPPAPLCRMYHTLLP